MGRTIGPTGKRDDIITLRVSDSEALDIDRKRARRNLTRSAYLRTLVKEDSDDLD